MIQLGPSESSLLVSFAFCVLCYTDFSWRKKSSNFLGRELFGFSVQSELIAYLWILLEFELIRVDIGLIFMILVIW